MNSISRRNVVAGVAAASVLPVVANGAVEQASDVGEQDNLLIQRVAEYQQTERKWLDLCHEIDELEASCGTPRIWVDGMCITEEKDFDKFFKKYPHWKVRYSNVAVLDMKQNFMLKRNIIKKTLANSPYKELNFKAGKMRRDVQWLELFIRNFEVRSAEGLKHKMEFFVQYYDPREIDHDVLDILLADAKRVAGGEIQRA